MCLLNIREDVQHGTIFVYFIADAYSFHKVTTLN